MGVVILIILVVIILFIIIHWFGSDGRLRENSRTYLHNSSGIFDTAAAAALRSYNKISNFSAADHFNRANIIRYNLLNGDLNVTTDRGRNAAVRRVFVDYAEAMRRPQTEIDPFFLNAVIGGIDMTPHMIEDDTVMRAIINLGDVYNICGGERRQEAIRERRAKSIAAASNRRDAVDNYFDTAVKYTNDAQNVHDSKVSSDLRGILGRLGQVADINQSITAARAYIGEKFSRDHPDRVGDALNALNKVADGEYITTFNTTENDIFARVWNRASDPANGGSREIIYDAIAMALSDCVERGSLTCINGRCGRVLNALVTIDYDPIVSGGVLTLEAYRNQIFQETKNIIDREIDAAKNSADSDLQQVAAAYEGGVAAKNDATFKDGLKKAIDSNLETYGAKLSAEELKNIREECHVYATI